MRKLALLLVLILAACGVPTEAEQDLFVNAVEARATAVIAEQYLTGTAQAPIINITETAAGLIVQQTQDSMQKTEVAAQWTHTPSPTATITPTVTPNITQTLAIDQLKANQQYIANNVERDNLELQRQRDANDFYSRLPALSFLLVVGTLAVSLIWVMRRQRYQPAQVDERGNILPILDVVDGKVTDVDTMPNYRGDLHDENLLTAVIRKKLNLLPQLPDVTVERQDAVKERDQMIDLRTRSAAMRKLTKNLEQKMLPADVQEQMSVADPDEYDLYMALPHWDLMRDWNGQADPLGFGKRGIITSKSSSLHLMISGKSGSGKTRFMLRTITTADLSKGSIVIDLGGPASVGFGVFRNHPNFYTAPVQAPREIVACLQSIYAEMKERKALIGGMDTDWEHWGSKPPRPFVTLLMDELGNMAEDLYYDGDDKGHKLWSEMWSLITRIGNEGRKVGIRFAAALQNPTSDSVDLRFRRNCTLVSFQLGDKAQSSAFLGSTGAEQLTEGHFMARVESVLFGGGFCPSDDEITEYLRSRQVQEAEPSRWIDAVVTKQVEGPREAPAQVDEVGQLAESIRGEWKPSMSKRAVGRLLGKEYAGAWAEKIDRVIERLTATTTQNMPVLGTEMA